MNMRKKIIAFMLVTGMLTGCSAKSSSSGSSAVSTEASTASVTEEATETEKTSSSTDTEAVSQLPLISITTKSDAPDVMDFVYEPVAKHVSESISEWDPTYEAPPEPYYEDCTISLKGSDGSSLMSPAAAKVKVRGNWTTLYKKKPLRIKFESKQNLLGLNGGEEFKNWLLLAEYKDGSMLRNKAALYASREILSEDGLYAADAELVHVEVNGKYLGVYLLTEMQQAAGGRVDIARPEKDYTGADIGYFLEFDGYFTNEDQLHSFPLELAGNAPLTPYDGSGGSGRTIQCLPASPDDNKKEIGVSIKSDIYSQEQHDTIAAFVNNVYRIMYEAAYNHKAFVFTSDDYRTIAETTDITPRQAVENVVNVQSLVDMYIISELTCDADIYWSSFFMDADLSADGSRKLTFEAPWDFDSSMGNRDRCTDGQGFFASNIVPSADGDDYEAANPWLLVLAYEDWYQDMIKDKWTKIYDSGVFDRTFQLIEDDKTSLEEDFNMNYRLWNNLICNQEYEDELSEPAKSCFTERSAAEYLLKWLRSRVEFLNSQWHR